MAAEGDGENGTEEVRDLKKIRKATKAKEVIEDKVVKVDKEKLKRVEGLQHRSHNGSSKIKSSRRY